MASGQDGLTLLLGKPNLQFGPPQHFNMPEDLSQFAFVDMNGDGRPDFVSLGPGGVYLSYTQADGTYRTGTVYTAGKVIGTATLRGFQ